LFELVIENVKNEISLLPIRLMFLIKRFIFALLVCLLMACGPSKEDLPRLIKELHSSESGVRNKAALSLARLGEEAKPALPDLINLLGDDNGGVRSSAAYALREIDTPEARKALDNYKK
jgi:HEAT repeat protein